MTIRTVTRRLDRLEAAFAIARSRAGSVVASALAKALNGEELRILEAKLHGKPANSTLVDVLTPEELMRLETRLSTAR